MAQNYELVYKQSVEKELRKLPKTHLAAVIKKIQSLTKSPYPPGVIKLQAALELYRIRQGDYRIIYQVNNAQLIVIVIKVGHRREIYRDR